MKPKIGIVGSGNIGWALKQMLKEDYEIRQGDITDGFDASNIDHVKDFLNGLDAVISAGPFSVNKNIASVASKEGIAYFDLTEDVETTDFIRGLKSKSILMPQCGLAPGAINICAAGMMEEFDSVSEVLMRVGALPRFTTNEMSYYLSWSTNGLINEYCNEADAIYEGKAVKLMPLEGAEKIVIEGESFEAFNTSGGCATMCETFEDKVENLTYKTIRYPGHLNHMKFLFNDLHLKKNKEILEKLFDKEVPRTKNDVIIFFVKVIGLIDGVLQEKTYLRKIYGDTKYSAIQLTTASGVCSVLKMFLDGKIDTNGFTKQVRYHVKRAKQMFRNTDYINRSLWDTLSGEYFRSFTKKADYFHIFDYWRWDEEEVNKTLLDTYGWETATDTTTTWRIGDGTAAFYNYIYHTVAGFTEHDTFRSNQIREGDISREEALSLVGCENRPRYQNVRWYLDTLGMDFEEVINAINSIPKIYESQ